MFGNLVSFDFIIDIGEERNGIGLNPMMENPS